MGWSRAARTDKGVSAVGQLVALKLMQPHKDMPAAINAHLPPVVRVFGVQRVTGICLAQSCAWCSCVCSKCMWGLTVCRWSGLQRMHMTN